MNSFNMRYPSSPECARYAELLPQFRHGTLTRAEDFALRNHLATCAYCQAHLADYDRLDAALSSYLGRFARTTPVTDDLVRVAVARVPSTFPAQLNHHQSQDQSQAPWMHQRDRSMFNYPDETTYEMPTLPRPGRRPPANTHTRPVLATIAALLLIGLAASLFALFGRPSSGPAHTATPTATMQQPTVTPQPTPEPTQTTTLGVVNSGHPCSSDTSGQTSYVQIGDLQVSRVGFLFGYPANELPATLDPSKPYQLTGNRPYPPNPPVNPSSSYSLTICNTSRSTSHVIRALTIRIAAFTAYGGTLNSWMFCDSYYQRPGGVAGGGCGGGAALDEWLQASFAANATTGAQVTSTQGTNPSMVPPLPLQLGPGQMFSIGLNVTLPTAPGTYTFAFGLRYDTITSAPISSMQPTIFDSAAVKWTGGNCTKPALLSQIPTNDTTGEYICAP
jgi:hypothetical protein